MSDTLVNTLSARQTMGLSYGYLTFSALIYRAAFTHPCGGGVEAYSPVQEFIVSDNIKDFTEKLCAIHLSFVEDSINCVPYGRVDENFLFVNGILIDALPDSCKDLHFGMSQALIEAEHAAGEKRRAIVKARLLARTQGERKNDKFDA